MGLVTLLAVSLLGSAALDAAQGEGAAESPGTEAKQAFLHGLLVDTSAVSPPLRVRHGALDPEKVREVVSSHRGELQGCYERAALENPQLSGSCTVRIVVAGDGTVGTASLQGSTFRSVSLGRCLLQLVRAWRFPPPADGKTAAVDYPLVFRKDELDGGS
jgi:TonB family protein